MKRTQSLRSQLFGLMALLVVLQSLSLSFALFVSRVYSMLDAEAFRNFGASTTAQVRNYNVAAAQLVSEMATTAKRLNSQLSEAAKVAGTSPDKIYQSDSLYLEAAEIGAETVMEILKKNLVSGAFLIFNGSNARQNDPGAHSAVHIRSAAPSNAAAANRHYLLELGPLAVSQQLNITTSVNWNLDLAVGRMPEPSSNFYHKPMEAAAGERHAEIERYAYWSPPVDMLGDGQDDVVFTLPLLDQEGAPYGVVGFEISMPLFNQFYLPKSNLPYHNSFSAIVPARQDSIQLDWFIPSGPIAQVYLKRGDVLQLTPVGRSDLFGARLEGLGDMYCSIQPLAVYSRNSPFYDDGWMLVSFAPKTVLHETSKNVRRVLNTSILGTTLLSFAAIFLLVYMTTRKISGLSAYIQKLSPHTDIHFMPTRIREIDELTAAVGRLNKSVRNASRTTSKILELTLLPIGGYEVEDESKSVTLTEYVRNLLSLEPGEQVTLEQWEKIHAELLASPAEGYENVYRVGAEAGRKWLRILETETDTGRVGVLLDVSEEIAERKRLVHELDYDSLTRLFNRTAFKRKAQQKIQSDPDKIGVMLFSDLDNLKYINDNFGHDMGDRLIIRAGEMFRSFQRLGGVVARISGDEFAIYLHGFSSRREAADLVYNQYRENIHYNLVTPDGQEHRVRCSSGMAFYPEDSGNVTDLLKLADFAMYEAKHNHKGFINEFNMQSYDSKFYLLENREAINSLLDDGLIRFAFQPIVDLNTGKLYAYEALMRPLLANFKSPDEILAVAQAQSKLTQLEQLVMRKAFRIIQENLRELGDTKIFVNSIPSQMMTEEDHLALVTQFSDILNNLVVEITEKENDDPEQLDKKLNFIHSQGIGIAFDDYGSGFSNEMRILTYRADIVKIDISLVSGIHANPDKQTLVTNLVSFCHAKGIRVVGEGVETREELVKLHQLGVDYVQGYYILRPQFGFASIPAEVTREILSLGDRGGE